MGLLATSFGLAFGVLALTCAHFDRDQICTQVDSSFSPFGHRPKANRDFTDIRHRRQGLRLAKNVFLFYFGISHLFGSITLSVLKFVHECVQFQKLAVVVLVLETTQNLVISRCCFAEDGKVCTKNFNARARPLFWSSNPLFGDVLRCFALGP